MRAIHICLPAVTPTGSSTPGAGRNRSDFPALGGSGLLGTFTDRSRAGPSLSAGDQEVRDRSDGEFPAEVLEAGREESASPHLRAAGEVRLPLPQILTLDYRTQPW